LLSQNQVLRHDTVDSLPNYELPEISINDKSKKMKNLTLRNLDEIFNEYALTTEEMICVKGGEAGEPILKPSTPPIKI
jgi:hypothetical protein